jgi:hypothetical protein
MEATWVWAGVWTSVTISGLLIAPAFLEFCKRNLPICFGMIMTLLGLYLLAPYSAGGRGVWGILLQVPTDLLTSLFTLCQHFIPV